MSKKILVLGIETSCDDTSICLLRGEIGASKQRPEVLALQSFSQDLLHHKWGGVVPEIAARNHLVKLAPLLENIFKSVSTSSSNLSPKNIDLIGVTTYPGLLGPLLTGVNAAKTLSLLYKLPLVGVNHLYAHLEAIHLDQSVSYPYFGVLVSGGHSLFLLAHSPTNFEVLGGTIDDAAGEAFDKGGKLLGLGYPAGQKIDQLAKQGDASAFTFPIGLRHSKTSELSYSGVKTSLRSLIEATPELYCHTVESQNRQIVYDVCASYQNAITEALILKAKIAIKQSNSQKLPIVVGGGVACNSHLRTCFKKEFSNPNFVSPKFCTDNGAMIANYALRVPELVLAYPDNLVLDAKGRFLQKNNAIANRGET